MRQRKRNSTLQVVDSSVKKRLKGTPTSILFVHPDMGIGGAEQLVVLAALGLQELQGYRLEILTAHHDKQHCFDETRDTLKVTCRGDWLPRTIFGRAVALCSIVRMFYLFLYLFCRRLYYGREFDIIVADVVSALNPLFRLCCKRLFFYCHYPDLLLCVKRGSWIKRVYRRIIDRIEEGTTAAADEILVNSQFTESVVRRTFVSLKHRALHVMYPPVDWATVTKKVAQVDNWDFMVSQFPTELASLTPNQYIVSLNRYERKKCIHRAIHAMAWLKEHARDMEPFPTLVIAGGYDPRVPENAEVYEELQEEVKRVGMKCPADVIFLRSIGDTVRWCLLRHAIAVVYTPSHEHFGIVPVEAMAVGAPVIACRSGGPVESVAHLTTGVLCSDANEKEVPAEFGKAIQHLLLRSERAIVAQREACQQQVQNRFSLQTFSEKFGHLVECSLREA